MISRDLDEIEPRVILIVLVFSVVGLVIGAIPGSVLLFLALWSNEVASVTLVAGSGVGTLVGAIAGSTSLLVVALRGRRHRHSSAGRRYQPDMVPQVD